MKRFGYIIILCLTLFAVTSVFADAGDDDRGIEDSRTFHVYDDVDLVSTLHFDYGRPKIIIKSVYPQLASETDRDGINSFNQLALSIVQDEVNQFRNYVKNLDKVQKVLPRSKITNNLYIDYDTSFIKSKQDHIISIRFSIQGMITGIPRPYHHHRVINYNLDTGQEIAMSDLFIPGSNYLAVIADYANSSLSRRSGNGGQIGTSAFENWNMKPNGLLITFEENTVAPSIYGAQTLFVPYSALQNVMSPDSPIADCIKHKRRCTNTNLLTGGFIDEAVNSHHRAFNPILSQL